mgnify:CR=1 FL=1
MNYFNYQISPQNTEKIQRINIIKKKIIIYGKRIIKKEN